MMAFDGISVFFQINLGLIACEKYILLGSDPFRISLSAAKYSAQVGNFFSCRELYGQQNYQLNVC